MKKTLLITIAMWCLGSCMVGWAQTDDAVTNAVHEPMRYGYLSYNDALHNMAGYAQAEKQVMELHEAYENELKRSEEQFSKAYAEYVEGQQTFPENILLKRQKELQSLMEQSMRFKQEARQLLAENEQKVMQPLRDRLDQAIYRVGMDRGLAFVLNTDNHAYPFLNPNVGIDVTADVLKLLK